MYFNQLHCPVKYVLRSIYNGVYSTKYEKLIIENDSKNDKKVFIFIALMLGTDISRLKLEHNNCAPLWNIQMIEYTKFISKSRKTPYIWDGVLNLIFKSLVENCVFPIHIM